MDGTRQDYEIESVLDMPAFEIESVKLLKPWETLAYVHGALDGAVLVKTRLGNKKAAVSKGTYYTPMGLSVVKRDNIKQVGQRKDNCRMLVDCKEYLLSAFTSLLYNTLTPDIDFKISNRVW